MLLAVDVNEVTDYYSVIRQPMDFSTIRRKLEVTTQNLTASPLRARREQSNLTFASFSVLLLRYHLGTLCGVMC